MPDLKSGGVLRHVMVGCDVMSVANATPAMSNCDYVSQAYSLWFCSVHNSHRSQSMLSKILAVLENYPSNSSEAKK